MARIPSLKNYSAEQLDRLISQAKKERDRIEKGAEELFKKVENMLKEHGVDVDELVKHFRSAKSAKKKTRRKKATRKKAAAKTAPAAPARKKATRKKATRKKAVRKKAATKTTAKAATKKRGRKKVKRTVPPKYRNPDNAEQTWAGRGRQPKWVEAALASGKTLDDLKI